MIAEILFSILKKIIVTLETFGYRVVVVVTDNNKINRKCIKNFNPSSRNEADYVYPDYVALQDHFIVLTLSI